jgi:D-sedoheptulose 7-phosphate isomerase
MTKTRETDVLHERITQEIQESIAVTTELAKSSCHRIVEAAALILACLRTGGKLIAFGNGGSAADAQHFVAELVGRYRTDRKALAAVALTCESASITAIANDFGFAHVFSRQLQAIAKPGDVAFAISTSGNSANVLTAVESARSLGLVAVGLTGRTGGKLADLVDVCLNTPSECTPRIQEAHSLIVHLICGLVEDAFASPAEHDVQLKTSAGEVR